MRLELSKWEFDWIAIGESGLEGIYTDNVRELLCKKWITCSRSFNESIVPDPTSP
jgi:hypothetical protein